VITDVPGVRVGHWTEPHARTGCTVVLLPVDTVASGEVRGGAPASRELDLLAPGRLVERIDAVLLTGGSAHGLAAADGVMRWCEERDLGFTTPGGAVPIVPSLALYDLSVGDGSVRPDAAAGYAACVAASHEQPPLGTVGAATGSTTNKWRGPEHARPGGFGAASRRQGAVVVAALVAVNAFGTVDVDGTGAAAVADVLEAGADVPLQLGASTTIGVVATNARLTKTECWLVAQSAHDGLARSVAPVHTRGDGDAFVTCATGTEDAAVEVIRALTVAVVEAAVRSVDTGGELVGRHR
jgi:L-aminopeptidase/D-esterase-like protein